MAKASDVIPVTVGAGTDLAAVDVNSKLHQVAMLAEADGTVIGSLPDYFWWFTPATNAASRSWADIFNAHASLVLRVRGIWVVPTATAITGVNIGFDVNKISAVGTGGTVITGRSLDSSFPAVDAAITARITATGGATLAHLLMAGYHFNEETNASLPLLQHQNLIPSGIGSRVAEIVLRQNQGVQVKQHAAGTVGLTGVLMYGAIQDPAL